MDHAVRHHPKRRMEAAQTGKIAHLVSVWRGRVRWR
jgi:hypothetical protein